MGSLSSGENITAWARLSRLVSLRTAFTNFPERGRARRHLLGPCVTELFTSDTAGKSEFF
jgi:hypothetical protein